MKINYEGSPEKDEVSPTLDYINFEVEVANINKVLGLSLNVEKISDCASKMGL